MTNKTNTNEIQNKKGLLKALNNIFIEEQEEKELSPQEEQQKRANELMRRLDEQTAEDLINETETEPFTPEERADLNISKVAKGKAKRLNR